MYNNNIILFDLHQKILYKCLHYILLLNKLFNQ